MTRMVLDIDGRASVNGDTVMNDTVTVHQGADIIADGPVGIEIEEVAE